MIKNLLLSGLSVVVPVYQSEKILPLLTQQLHAFFKSLTIPYEVIFVNDGSEDGSWRVLQGLILEYPSIRTVNLLRNYGQHNALLCGIRMARYDVIVTMDDDLQHPPHMIPSVIEPLSRGYDVVYGVPQRKEHGLARNMATTLAKLMLRFAAGIHFAGDVSAFRAFPTKLRDAFTGYSGAFVSIDVLLAWGARRYLTVPVLHQPRQQGRSNYNLIRLAKHFINMVTGFSIWPLRFVSVIGFFFTLIGLAVLVTAAFWSLSENRMIPTLFLAAMISLFAGAQLFALGIMGEYLACIHFRNMGRPAYVIMEESGAQNDIKF